MKLIQQSYDQSCAAACFAMVTGVSEDAAIKLCKTTNTGTPIKNVQLAFSNLNINSFLVELHEEIQNLWWIPALSNKYPLILSGRYVNTGVKGGINERHHAVAVEKEQIFDPSCKYEFDFHSYREYNAALFIKHVLIIERELPDYGRNS